MNKNCYRIVFNKVRGMLMAVAETTVGQAKASGTTPRGPDRIGASMWATLRPATFYVLATFSLIAWNVPHAQAQVVADPTAPVHQRPTTLSAANGVPLVNLQTPSAAGVSRNSYKQFDVQQQGVILNNSRTNAQTQLGGWVQGNPYLAAGTARVILNEVNSTNPSLLRGYVEVAGSRAQVVIANPAGISCDGCGFINADRSTLTTGTPILSGGSLEGYRVQDGTIIISGAGLDDSRTDYSEVIARSVQVNGGIWANELKVTTGANQVDTAHAHATPITGTGAAPAFGIDVAQLGGMYAGKITLVGTESGVGVRNAGNIGATAGDVIVTAYGRLENTRQIASVGSTRIDVADDIRNNGAIHAQAGINLRTPGALDNSGGLIRAGGTLSIDADHLSNANTQSIDQGIEGQSAHISARGIDNRLGTMRADSALTVTSHGTLDNTQGLISSVQTAAIQDADLFDKTLAIINTNGTLIANQMLNVDTFSLTGDGDVLSAGDLSVKLTEDYTHTGRLQATGNASLATTGVLTNQSTLLAAAALDLKAASVNNQTGGEIVGGEVNLIVTAPNTLINRGLIDGRDTFIETATLNNVGTGRIYGDHIAIRATTVNNEAESGAAPVIAARDRLDIGAQTINNGEGALIFTVGDIAIGGGLDTDKHAIGQAAAVNNTSATIEALGDLTIDAAALNNKRSAFSTTRVLSTELPAGLELLAYDPALEFFWDIVETAPVNWRNHVRDLYINHIDSIAGIDMSPNYRNELVALVDAQPLAVYQDSINVWNLLINKINNDHSEWIDAMAARLSGQTFPLRSYDQRCRDDECDYITYVTQRRTDYKDMVTSMSPSATIRAGGSGSLVVGALTNQYSTIETGDDLVLVGNTLLNEGAELYLQSDILSTGYTRHWVRSPQSPFSSASSTSRLLETIPAVISAGGALTGSFTGRIDNVAIRENSAPSSTTGTTVAALNVSDIGQAATGANNTLFGINTANGNRPLIETDPRFAGYRSWLSSDYMLQQLSLDPAGIHQRLGDGFYEQQLIREQVGQLTGRRFLDGYANDEAQYRALLDTGLLYAQEWDLVPGIGLSAAQMAQLTSDMVWLVEQTITLADGSQKTVLAPQVYVRVKESDLLTSGALIEANDLQLNATGNALNSGTITGRSIVRISADTIDILGGSMRAGDLLEVNATSDLNIVSSTNEIKMTQVGTQNRVTLNQLNSIAGLYVTNTDGILVASAGRDINLGAALITNHATSGQTVLSAGRDLNLGAVA
ncbi:MAG TPA: filamentous hemagglutinin N-terminal domain-containing protein, partial [Burkholderiales bacterium]